MIQDIYWKTGWNFLPQVVDSGSRLALLTYPDDIKESLEILFSTLPGQRIAHPNYGCDLMQYVFKPINNTLLTAMEDTIRASITLYEPRIDLQSVSVTVHPSYNYQLQIELSYILRVTNTRYDITLPFYTMEDNG